jgi:hypothetical protein
MACRAGSPATTRPPATPSCSRRPRASTSSCSRKTSRTSRSSTPNPVTRGSPAAIGPRRAWPLFQGAGLTLLTHLAALASPVLAPYEICHGVLRAANDCLGHKGWLMKRLALSNGAAVDVWNTHLDAGSGPGDQAARQAQLGRLAAAIHRESRGRAVVAGGDFNLDWDTPHERALLERFLARTGLAIAALTPAGAWTSRLDYLLYRPAPDAPLAVREAGMAEDFVDAEGRPLSDHPAIFAVFEVRMDSEGPRRPSRAPRRTSPGSGSRQP